MEYYLLRKQFCELSGRYDLMNSDYTDNGADFYINAAQRYLDRLMDTGKMKARNVQSVAASQIIVKSLGIRSIDEVWYSKSDGTSLYELNKETLTSIKAYYGSQLSTNTGDAPIYYAPANLRPYPDITTTATWTGYKDIEDLTLDNVHYKYNGIVIMPAPTVACYISIVGLFYSPELTATLNVGVWTQTKSIWTESYPETLISAAIYKLHALHLNTGGAQDYKALVLEDTIGLDHDAAEEDIAGQESEIQG